MTKKKAAPKKAPGKTATSRPAASKVGSAPVKGGPIDAVVDAFTDGAMLAAFDPVVCEGARNRTMAGFRRLLLSGKAALISIGGDCAYRVRVTDGELTPLEREHVEPGSIEVGVEVASGRLYVGGNSPPGYSEDFYEGGDGQLIAVPKGAYRVTAYAIDVPKRLQKHLPDFVLTLAPITERLTLRASTARNPFDGTKMEVLPNRLGR